jgi:hypothetical protein
MRCANCNWEIELGDLFCGRCGVTRQKARGYDPSPQQEARRHDPFAQRKPEFREVFRKLYVTGFSIRVLLWTIFQVIFGLLFSAWLLVCLGVVAPGLIYIIFGLDLYPPLDIKSMTAHVRPSIGGIIEAIVATIVTLAFWAYLGPHNLIRFKRRLSARLYVMAGRPLASVEGEPTLDSGSEITMGVEVGEFYFSFEDCWLKFVDGGDLDKLDRAGGAMRIWYIPTDVRTYKSARTGEVVKDTCILVWAEWRPLI